MEPLRYAIALWSLVRLEYGLSLAVTLNVSYVLAYARLPEFAVILLLSLIAILSSMVVFAFNDFFDRDTDRANNRRDRPIVRGDISPGQAVAIGLLSFPALILALAFLGNLLFGILVVAIVFFGILYDVRIKKYGILGNAYSGLAIASPFLFTYLSFRAESILLVFAVAAFIIGVGREIMMAMRDTEGDRAAGNATVPVVLGVKKAGLIVVSHYTLCFVIIVAPIIIPIDPRYHLNAGYLVFLLAWGLMMALSSWLLLYRFSTRMIGTLRKITITAMVFLVLGLLLCGLQMV